MEKYLQEMLFGKESHYEKHRFMYNWQMLETRFRRNHFKSVTNLTGIDTDRHTDEWQWVVNEIRDAGGHAPPYSLIVEGTK